MKTNSTPTTENEMPENFDLAEFIAFQTEEDRKELQRTDSHEEKRV